MFTNSKPNGRSSDSRFGVEFFRIRWLALLAGLVFLIVSVGCKENVAREKIEQLKSILGFEEGIDYHVPDDMVCTYLYDSSGKTHALLRMHTGGKSWNVLSVVIDTNSDGKFEKSYYFPEYQPDPIVSTLSEGRLPEFETRELLGGKPKDRRLEYGDTPLIMSGIPWADLVELTVVLSAGDLEEATTFDETQISEYTEVWGAERSR